MPSITLGQRLIKLRNQAGSSQDAPAKQLGVSRQSVSKWETDASTPVLNKVVKLSELFAISPDELVKGETPRRLRGRRFPDGRAHRPLAQVDRSLPGKPASWADCSQDGAFGDLFGPYGSP